MHITFLLLGNYFDSILLELLQILLLSILKHDVFLITNIHLYSQTHHGLDGKLCNLLHLS